jgi:mono/diheme cytochrome c family protein
MPISSTWSISGTIARMVRPGLAFAVFACASAFAATDETEFFETKIRPLLAVNCHACHTRGALGGLRLDSREGVLKGGKSGKAVVEGKPDESLLMQAVRRTHSRLKMPPVGALTKEEVEALEEWIRRGVPWPEKQQQIAAASPSRISAEQRAFWSFQPVKKAVPPAVKNKAWPRTGIDRFILAKLEAANLKPAREADKRTWIRRATLDVTGLPPDPRDVDAFVNDKSASAKEKVVDRLLASPHYGERWARHWLDLARYSDGELGASVDTPLRNAWRYRDWVVEAFNSDLPYSTFVKAQIAADLLPETKEHIAGLGFQALGEGANDQLDVTTKVFLGLTVGCAQCHDHKYDPIPTADYYSLLGIFRSTQTTEHPLVSEAEVERYKSQKKKIEALEETLTDYLADQTKQLTDLLARDTARYMVAAWKGVEEEPGLDCETLSRWRTYLANPNKEHPYLKPWYDMLATNPTEAQVRGEAERYQQFILALLEEAKEVDDKNYVAFGGKKGLKDEKTRQYTNIVALPVLKFYQWREIANGPYSTDGFRAPAGVLYYGPKEIDWFLGGFAKEYVEKLRAEIKALEKDLPPLYPFLHSVKDAAKPDDIRIAIRGDSNTLGEIAPRRFLQILCDGEPARYINGSGRAQLAQAIASDTNPLTARVIVNRVWQHHFGKGIVRTPSNFGRMGERPTHPELLDYLAADFVANGWSLKKLHRNILLSSTYAQATGPNPDADADNRLLSHFDLKHRLDMETLRDSVLTVSGKLDSAVGGAAKSIANDNFRRSLYLTVSRTRLDPAMALFDFPDANASADERTITAGPLQGLYWLNSEFVADQAKALAERLVNEAGVDTQQRIRRAYQLLYARLPDSGEVKLGVEYLRTGGDTWVQYLQSLISAAEFASVN